jgi:hypothetical protein
MAGTENHDGLEDAGRMVKDGGSRFVGEMRKENDNKHNEILF